MPPSGWIYSPPFDSFSTSAPPSGQNLSNRLDLWPTLNSALTCPKCSAREKVARELNLSFHRLPREFQQQKLLSDLLIRQKRWQTWQGKTIFDWVQSHISANIFLISNTVSGLSSFSHIHTYHTNTYPTSFKYTGETGDRCWASGVFQCYRHTVQLETLLGICGNRWPKWPKMKNHLPTLFQYLLSWTLGQGMELSAEPI